ncbi:MAG TPA: hypothetical protein VGG76_02110 [Gemmatimonadaceae bacterium]|jgi:hypothetical protein
MQQPPTPTREWREFYFIVERQHGSSEEGRTQEKQRAQELRRTQVEPQEHRAQEQWPQVEPQEQFAEKEQPQPLGVGAQIDNGKAGDNAGFFL